MKEANKEELELVREQNKETLNAFKEYKRAQLESLKEAQNNELENLRDAQSEQLNAVKEANADKLQSLKEANDEQLSALKDANADKLAELKEYIKKEKDLLKTSDGTMGDAVEQTAESRRKAAEIANMALMDMSDNVNKMGSRMEDVQNAYMGFSKQNYTMLDNLKLGRQSHVAQLKPRENGGTLAMTA